MIFINQGPQGPRLNIHLKKKVPEHLDYEILFCLQSQLHLQSVWKFLFVFHQHNLEL